VKLAIFYFGVFGKSRRGREHEHGGKCRDLHVEAGHVSDQLASVPSVMARGLSPTRTETLVMPSTEEDRLREAGGACSVEGHIAFDLLHDLWIWPLSTVSEPKRFNMSSARRPSSVPHPQSA
jgi:hypothetical protein